jgi:hypothetical protein
MKDFTKKSSWLEQASQEIRVTYTLFIVFALVGHLSFILISVTRIGPTISKIISHYRGDPTNEMSFPKEFMELLEVTHFHAYIEGILLLVLAHLFAAVPLSKKIKMIVIATAFGSTFLDLSAPWLIRYLTLYAAYLQVLAWTLMCVSYLPLTIAPVYYMWKGPTPKE